MSSKHYNMDMELCSTKNMTIFLEGMLLQLINRISFVFSVIVHMTNLF